MLNIFKKSKFPKRIPISRMEDYHTHYLGKCSDGKLFFGCETFAFKKPHWEVSEEAQEANRLEYAIVYLFDKEGNFIEVKYWSSANQSEKSNTSDELEVLIKSLGEIQFSDITVNLFETEIDGIKCGLIPNEELESIDLQPSSTISFQEPWDGEYYT